MSARGICDIYRTRKLDETVGEILRVLSDPREQDTPNRNNLAKAVASFILPRLDRQVLEDLSASWQLCPYIAAIAIFRNDVELIKIMAQSQRLPPLSAVMNDSIYFGVTNMCSPSMAMAMYSVAFSEQGNQVGEPVYSPLQQAAPAYNPSPRGGAFAYNQQQAAPVYDPSPQNGAFAYNQQQAAPAYNPNPHQRAFRPPKRGRDDVNDYRDAKRHNPGPRHIPVHQRLSIPANPANPPPDNWSRQAITPVRVTPEPDAGRTEERRVTRSPSVRSPSQSPPPHPQNHMAPSHRPAMTKTAPAKRPLTKQEISAKTAAAASGFKTARKATSSLCGCTGFNCIVDTLGVDPVKYIPDIGEIMYRYINETFGGIEKSPTEIVMDIMNLCLGDPSLLPVEIIDECVKQLVDMQPAISDKEARDMFLCKNKYPMHQGSSSMLLSMVREAVAFADKKKEPESRKASATEKEQQESAESESEDEFAQVAVKIVNNDNDDDDYGDDEF